MSNTIGNSVDVTFVDTNKTLKGKVDTGATTSCLHGENIKVSGNRVSFTCSELSPNTITVDAAGSQQVKSADGGVSDRPIIKLNISINGINLQGATFNLNDRSTMDCPLLIGQNILKAGDFVVDVNQNIQEQVLVEPQVEPEEEPDPTEQVIKQAIQTLIQHNVSLADILRLASE